MFMAALKSMDKLDQPLFGDLKPDDSVDLYFNLSSEGNPDNDQPAPWIKQSSFKYVADPVKEVRSSETNSRG